MRGSGKRRDMLEKKDKKKKNKKRKGKEPVSVITPNTFAFDVAVVIFPPPGLHVAREQFQDHSNAGGVENIESMLPPASECRVIV